jgi:hypothetical protein
MHDDVLSSPECLHPILQLSSESLIEHSLIFEHLPSINQQSSSYIVQPVEACGVLSEQFFGTHFLTLFVFVSET